MYIELIGCTSAGKSTMAGNILQGCREQGLDIFLGEDFVLKQFRLNWVKSRLLRKLLVNLTALCASLVTWRNNRKFYLFASDVLFRLPIASLDKLNLLRNVLKKIGMYEIIRSRSTDQQVILVDEGVLQAAHHLFVHVSVDVKMEHLSTFMGLVPLSDVVVYLKQPEALLIDRTMKRGHQRIPDRSYGKVVRFINQAVSTFDTLVQYPVVENRVLVVDGGPDRIRAAYDHHDPIMGLALKIIRCGFNGDTTDTPTKTILVSDRHDVPMSSNSLLENGLESGVGRPSDEFLTSRD